MADLGGTGNLPFTLGGEPNAEAKIYDALRGAIVGDGVAAPDDYQLTTFDGLWRASKSAGLAAAQSVDEAAHWQAFPHTATDEIPTYEDILGLTAAPGASINERRQAVVARWTSQSDADYPSLGAELAAISAQFSMVAPSRTNAGYISPGKSFDDVDTPDSGGNYAGYRACTLWPNFSDDYIVSVLLNVGAGVPPLGDTGDRYNRAFDLLDNSLPAWNDFQIYFSSGFTLDTSLLDVTALTES